MSTNRAMPRCVILAGGLGTRISEESHLRPKPMIEIGTRPILWHIMKSYGHHGVTDFIICLGYRGYAVKEYFLNYLIHQSDITVDVASNSLTFHDQRAEPWKVTLIDSGEDTMTGGRLLRVRPHIDDDEPIFLTYGDGLSDVDITAELAFHRQHGRLATMTVVRPSARYGTPVLEGDSISSFLEKSQANEGLINGGFFVVQPGALDYIDGDDTPWETAPLTRLAAEDQLRAWRHTGFWQPMDTVRERDLLEEMWASGKAPWKTWE